MSFHLLFIENLKGNNGALYIPKGEEFHTMIATKSGGPECIVNAQNGLLVPVQDVDALADAMLKMFNNINIYDSNKIREDCVSRFGEKSVVSALAEIYGNILKDNRGRGLQNEY